MAARNRDDHRPAEHIPASGEVPFPSLGLSRSDDALVLPAKVGPPSHSRAELLLRVGDIVVPIAQKP